MSFLEILRIILGSIYVLFLPGFIITFIFFEYQKKKSEVDWLERIVLSFAFSIAVVPLVVFLLNLLGINITTLNVFLEILAIIIISSIILFIKHYKFKK